MRPEEGSAGVGGGTGGRTHPPGSRPSRLSDASKQLSILLQDVDLDDEPALAEALTDAVRAVARADEVVDDGCERGRSVEVERSSSVRREWRDEEDRPAVREPNDRRRGTIDSGRFGVVPEAGVE
ncbi:MAG TPA: hypothetical protein VKA37_06955 [Halobacteriales archaeon]|nr:hypothetical protein [Halobacteriales archaeon]